MNRRYKYFDLIHEGHDQKEAFDKVRSMTKQEINEKKYG